MKSEITNDKLRINQLFKTEANQLVSNNKNIESFLDKDSFTYWSICEKKIIALCALEERKWDTKFFKRKMGIINILCFVENPGEDIDKLLKVVLTEAEVNYFKHLILRVKNYNYNIMRAAELNEFKFMDAGTILTTIENKITEFKTFQDKNVREMLSSDISFIQSYIANLFRHSYFYRDSFFSRVEADNLFKTWLNNCFTEYSEKVFVYENNNQAIGFVTCSVDKESNGQIPLVGVHEDYSGKGIATTIIRNSLNWYHNNGIKNIYVKTQSQNVAAINLYIKNTFTVDHVDCTYTKTIK